MRVTPNISQNHYYRKHYLCQLENFALSGMLLGSFWQILKVITVKYECSLIEGFFFDPEKGQVWMKVHKLDRKIYKSYFPIYISYFFIYSCRVEDVLEILDIQLKPLPAEYQR